MKKPVIAISGANGQLGWELQQLSKKYNQFNYIFLTRNEFNLEDKNSINTFFNNHEIDFFINTAAYTQVDLAESEKEKALAINTTAVSEISKICFQKNIQFIHFSTDYVFNGLGNIPFLENNETNPINYYGYTKLKGEVDAIKNNSNSIIIRTSWVYSSHGKNFVNTVLRMMNEKDEISVVNDQLGSPTYAKDLASVVLKICEQILDGNQHRGIYHFCNQGIISWFQFAQSIQRIKNLSCKILPISTNQFPTKAKRPAFSALNTQKIQKDFNINIPNWETSLQNCLNLK
jgi:dTDP-4-dehydrorhamnose reductase